MIAASRRSDVGEVLAAAVAVGVRGLEPALALALEHRDLVAVAASLAAFWSSLEIRRRACTRSLSPAFRAVFVSDLTCSMRDTFQV